MSLPRKAAFPTRRRDTFEPLVGPSNFSYLSASMRVTVRWPISLLLFLALVTVSLQAEEPTGQQIVRRVLANFPQKDFLREAHLSFTDEKGQEKSSQIQVQTHSDSNVIRTAVVVVTPPAQAEEAVLLMCDQDGRQEIWRRWRDKAPSKLTSDQLGQSFAGSDFTYEDFGFGYLRWAAQKLVDQKRRQSRDCYVVESAPAKGQSGQYSKILSWIDKENLLLMCAEGYGLDGKLLKVFDVRALKRFEGGWFIKTMNLKNVAVNRQTKLEVTQFEYALNLDERFFSPQTFGRIAAFKFPQGTKNF